MKDRCLKLKSKAPKAIARTRGLIVVIAAALLTSILPTSAAPGVMTVFGPKTYTRTSGPPDTFTDTFLHCGTAPCEIVVINGNEDGTKRISSASIEINGVEVVAPSDFNQNVGKIVKPVTLTDTNEITIRLSSKPGSFLIVEIDCASPADLLSVGAGVSLLDAMTLSAAIPIINDGSAAAQNVQVTAITLAGATPTSPSLPFNLGTIPAGDQAVLNASFIGGPFTPGSNYVVMVQGTYNAGGFTFCFGLNVTLVIPPAAPGMGVLKIGLVPPNLVSGGGFPPMPPPLDLGDVDFPGWTVPIAPFVPDTNIPSMTGTLPSPLVTLDAPSPIVFLANNGLGLNGNSIAEPSGGATGGGVVFATANSFAAYSTNGGSTWTRLDPTTIFPNGADGGFCCDQIVQYVPGIDRFIWLMQFRRGNGPGGAGTGPNRMRIASASPAAIVSSGGTAWTYWDLTSGLFGLGNNWLDYPDLSVGNNSLYMSCDEVGTGLLVVRMPLSQIAASSSLLVEYTDPTLGGTAYGAHLMQDTLNEIFWAGHKDNTHLRVFSLAEGSNTYFWRDIGISSWPTAGMSSTTPDGMDWLTKLRNFPGNAAIGATRSGNQLWFAWSAGTDNNFHQPHVQLVALDRANNFNKIQQVKIWNNSYAFAYPALATDACSGEVGLSLEYGGNGNYENHVVGFWGDFVVYITTASNVGTTRYGDYVSIRQGPFTAANPGNLMNAFGYGLNMVAGGGTRTDIRYVVFGRPAAVCSIIP